MTCRRLSRFAEHTSLSMLADRLATELWVSGIGHRLWAESPVLSSQIAYQRKTAVTAEPVK